MNSHSLTRALITIALTICLTACAASPTQRMCTGPLVPINAPTPAK